jgi:HEAT repeat protein
MDIRKVITFVLSMGLGAAIVAAAPAPDSKRLGRAKDFIADEQWSRAVAELKVVVANPKEPNRDEALFWLAHSEHQAGDQAAAIETVARLERDYPSSAWVRPARSLRIEIAQRLRRDDLLWWTAAPPPPPPAPVSPVPGTRPPAAPRIPTPAPPPHPSTPAPVALSAPPVPSAAPGPPAPPTAPVPPAPEAFPSRYRFARPPTEAFPPLPPDETAIWIPEPFEPDVDLRIQALSGLLRDHAEQVIPLLKEIAFDTGNPADARRAIFVLGQSNRADARSTIVDVAKRGSVLVRIAAIRELGRVNLPNVGVELMQVYSAASNDARIKREVVSSLGARADSAALLRIARTETDAFVRNTAIITLGRTGAREQLATLYLQAPRDSRSAVLTALLAAKDEDQLIKIAQTEQDDALRRQALRQLRMLGTPKALRYLNGHR